MATSDLLSNSNSDSLFLSSFAGMDLEAPYDSFSLPLQLASTSTTGATTATDLLLPGPFSSSHDNVMSSISISPASRSAPTSAFFLALPGTAASGASSVSASASASTSSVGRLPPVGSVPDADADLSAFQFADVPDYDDLQAVSFASFPPQLLPPEYKQHYDAAASSPLDSEALFSQPTPIRSTRSSRLAAKKGAANASDVHIPVASASPVISASLPAAAPSTSTVVVAAPSRSLISEPVSPASIESPDGDDETSDSYKKELHRNTERQRRQKTNDAMNSLRRLIGNKYKKKLAILTETIRQFQSMQQELQHVTAENQQLKQRMDKNKDVKVEVVNVPYIDWGAVFLHNDIGTAISSLDMKFLALNHAFTQATGHRLTAELTWQAITPAGQMADAYTVMASLLSGDPHAVVTRDKQMIVTASGDLLPCKVVYSIVKRSSPSQSNHIMIQLFPLPSE